MSTRRYAETEVSLPEIGIYSIPVGHQTGACKRVEGAAPDAFSLTLYGAFRVANGILGVSVALIPIRYPFPYIAAHIVQAQQVGVFAARFLYPAGISFVNGYLVQVQRVIGRYRSNAPFCRVLPLGFCRQAVMFSGKPVEPLEK